MEGEEGQEKFLAEKTEVENQSRIVSSLRNLRNPICLEQKGCIRPGA